MVLLWRRLQTNKSKHVFTTFMHCLLFTVQRGRHWKQKLRQYLCLSFSSTRFYFSSTLLLCAKKTDTLSGVFVSTSKLWIPPVFIISCGAFTVQNIKGSSHTGGFTQKVWGFWKHKGSNGASGHGCYQTWVTYAPCCPWMHPFHIHYRSFGSPP